MTIKSMLRPLAWIGGLLILYVVLGFWLIPAVIQQQAPQLIARQIGRNATLAGISLNPFAAQITVDGFMLAEVDGQPFVSFERLAVDLDIGASLWQQALVVDSVELVEPAIAVARHADGTFNFSSLQQTPAQAEQPEHTAKPLPVVLQRLKIEQGSFAWRDATSAAFKTETVHNLNAEFLNIQTANPQPLTFSIRLDSATAGQLALNGEASLQPLSAKGQLKLGRIDLVKLWQQLALSDVAIDVADGGVMLQADFAMVDQDSGLALTVAKGAVEIGNLSVKGTQDTTELLRLPKLAVQGVALDLNKKQLSIDSITSSNARIKTWLNADGTSNFQQLFRHDADPSPKSVSSAAKTDPSWTVGVNSLSLQGYAVDFTDNSPVKPVPIVLTDMNVTLKQYRTTANPTMPLQFATHINGGGKIELNGDLALAPFAAAWSINLQNIDLKIAQSYLESVVKLDVISGEFSTSGKLNLAATANDPFKLNYRGDANIANLVMRDRIKNKDFVKWTNLELNEVYIDLPDQVFKLGQVVLNRPYLRFLIKQDGTTNIADIVVAEPQSKAADKNAVSKAKPSQQPGPQFAIGKILLQKGLSDFADYSLILPFITQMNDLNGSVAGFSSEKGATADLTLQGRVYDLANVAIKGRYRPDNNDSAISLSFKNMPLPLITPYMAEFAGYKIEKGQMALDLRYKIAQGQLDAQNNLLIDQLTLGEKVDNPKAVSLPLNLAIALLKDADGKINLDLPITGSLDDPQFSVSALVGKVLVNLVTKVVTSPFKALGSMFADEQDYSHVEFAAGSADLAGTEMAKLDRIAGSLQSKPELLLEVKGMAFEKLDWQAMRFAALYDQLRKIKAAELRNKGQTLRAEYIELTDEEYRRLLTQLFMEKFPLLADFSTFGAPRLKGAEKGDFYEVAREKLEAIMLPEAKRLNDLAVARAGAIGKYLTQQAGIDSARVFILATEVDTVKDDGIVAALSLNVMQ